MTITVWRLENVEGLGPYVDKATTFNGPTDSNPLVDFGVPYSERKKWFAKRRGWRFAFPDPEAAIEWFGLKRLQKLEEKGFYLVPKEAQKVEYSYSGLQVVYLPLEEDFFFSEAETAEDFRDSVEDRLKKEGWNSFDIRTMSMWAMADYCRNDPEKWPFDKSLLQRYLRDLKKYQGPSESWEQAWIKHYEQMTPRQRRTPARVWKKRKNPARARRSENRKIEKHSVDEFGEEWTDVDYEWVDYPPFLTEGHFDLPMVKEAARIASRAKESKQLGRGHFGEAFVVETSKGPVIVKVAAERMLYQDQRPWTRKEQQANLMHEAGVANELEEMGYDIVPRSVYVELDDGTPAIVREYGEEVAPGELSGREFYDLENALFSLEEDTGWRVQDDLLLLRRPDGSLFIGDVGIWAAPDVGRQRKERLLYSNLPSLLTKLGERLFGQRVWSLGEVQRLQKRLEEHRREGRDPDHVFTKMFRKDLEKVLASREAVGIPSPSKAYQILESEIYGE